MKERYHVIWEGNTIGLLENLSRDMWYIEGTWLPAEGEQAAVFASLLPEAGARERLAAPATLPRVVLSEVQDGHKLYCLAFVLIDGILGLRQLTSREGLDEFFPGR